MEEEEEEEEEVVVVVVAAAMAVAVAVVVVAAAVSKLDRGVMSDSSSERAAVVKKEGIQAVILVAVNTVVLEVVN